MRNNPKEFTGFYDRLETSAASQFAAIAAIAVSMLLVFNSAALVRWTEGLPSSDMSDRASGVAVAWHQLMEDAGTAEVMVRLKRFAAETRRAPEPTE